jgi:rubrerythrin
MEYDFNADEVFEMAEQIERNGAEFYRKAADDVTDSSARTLLQKLAAMEDAHEKTFAVLRKDLTDAEKEPIIFDPQGENALYLKALADSRVFFDKDIDTSSLETILKDAIVAEKDSIVFYLGMKEIVPQGRGQERVDRIIKEEMDHIKILTRELLPFRK